MASTADRNDPVGEPPGGDGSDGRSESRLPGESPSPYGPELGPRPHVLLMTVIGGIGGMCVVIAVVLGVSTDRYVCCRCRSSSWSCCCGVADGA